jgi:hypothetical protein
MMTRYFTRSGDSPLGQVTVWYEFDGDVPVRQVERYGDRWFSSRDDYHPDLGPGRTDQPPAVLGLGETHATTAESFDAVWREAAGPD